MATQSNYVISEGVRKSAILLMSLEEDDAAALLSKLPRRYVEQVSLAIAQLDTISGVSKKELLANSLQADRVHLTEHGRVSIVPSRW